MSTRFVHTTPRLSVALDMLSGYNTIADIGCDHGRLTAALLQKDMCSEVIASDISEPSLNKARQLISHIDLSDRVSFRIGDGCSVLHPFEADAITMLGMGGTLMCRILDACPLPLMGAKAVILQPMRAQDEIRRYLYQNRYHIVADKIVSDHGRLYQIFKAEPDTCFDYIPQAFPSQFFDVGYKSFAEGDPLLSDLCRQQLFFHEKMLKNAEGTEGEVVLAEKINALKQILKGLEA